MGPIDDSAKMKLATQIAMKLINDCVDRLIVTEDEGNAYFDILVDGLMEKNTEELLALATKGMEDLHG